MSGIAIPYRRFSSHNSSLDLSRVWSLSPCEQTERLGISMNDASNVSGTVTFDLGSRIADSKPTRQGNPVIVRTSRAVHSGAQRFLKYTPPHLHAFEPETGTYSELSRKLQAFTGTSGGVREVISIFPRDLSFEKRNSL